VAVDPPEEVCRRLAEWAREAARGARGGLALRVLDPELLHVTLCFLGNRPASEMDLLGDQLAACGGEAGELSVGAPLWLPPRRPRALAVELHDEHHRLARLQANVAEALTEAEPDGHEQPGAKRRFRPHVTVARMGRGDAPRERALPATPALSFVPTELVLYRSWLSPQGASYEAVAAHPIG
jgi:RNA 2',3'-cyclic 3'-phosphodiesterase